MINAATSRNKTYLFICILFQLTFILSGVNFVSFLKCSLSFSPVSNIIFEFVSYLVFLFSQVLVQV